MNAGRSVNERDLDAQARGALAAIATAWKRDVFYPARERGGFEQDCRVCADIFWDLALAIDDGGHVASLDVVRIEIDCPAKTDAEKAVLQQAALDGVRAVVFPQGLRAMTLTCRFGEVTRC